MKMTRERLEEIKAAPYHAYLVYEDLIAHAEATIETAAQKLNRESIEKFAQQCEEKHPLDKYPVSQSCVPSRAEIAMHAMAGLLASRGDDGSEWISKSAIVYADTLLAELKKPQ